MLQTIRDFFNTVSHAGEEKSAVPTDHRLAVAAILVHIVSVDGIVTEDEKRRLREVLSSQYNLSAEETEVLIAEASKRDDEAVDLYGFTSVLKRELDENGRREVVELMWEIVYADGELSEFEDNVVWRVAELIGISTRDRVVIRQRIEQKRAPS